MSAKYLTVEQAAERLQVSSRHIVRMIEAGRLKAKDIGLASHRIYRIPESEIEASLEAVEPVTKPRRRRKPVGIPDYLNTIGKPRRSQS